MVGEICVVFLISVCTVVMPLCLSCVVIGPVKGPSAESVDGENGEGV